MRRSSLICVVAGLALAGCGSLPERPESRADWEALHTRTYEGVTPGQVLEASEEILALVDDDFTFDYPPDRLDARRPWYVYMVLAAANGQDHWRIETEETEAGTKVMVRIHRQTSVTTPSPTATVDGTMGAGVNTSSMPGDAVWWAGPYRLFWSRLDYKLGVSDEWLTCAQAQERFAGEFNGQDTGVLCGVTVADRKPDTSES